jgi:ATP-dependent Clp protease ATP-binding subunit ClpA
LHRLHHLRRYNKIFEKDRALSRRFQKIDITEPSQSETVEILKGLRPKYEEFHRVHFSDDALEAAVRLSAQFITERRLPDKAIDVIDEAGARARISAFKLGQKGGETPSGEGTSSEGASGEAPMGETVVDIQVPEIETVCGQDRANSERSVSSSEKERLSGLEVSLKQEVFGQDAAIDAVVRAVSVPGLASGLRTSRWPISFS